jgi:hypothetical protein
MGGLELFPAKPAPEERKKELVEGSAMRVELSGGSGGETRSARARRSFFLFTASLASAASRSRELLPLRSLQPRSSAGVHFLATFRRLLTAVEPQLFLDT